MRARKIAEDAGEVSAATRFSYVVLREPEKALVLDPAATPHREVTMLLTDLDTLRLRTLIVDLTESAVTGIVEIDPKVDGFGPTLDEDFVNIDDVVKEDSRWVAALAKRGVTDLDTVRTVPLSAGVFGYADEVGRRMYRVLAFVQHYPLDSAWAHPIDGVVAHVDIDAARCCGSSRRRSKRCRRNRATTSIPRSPGRCARASSRS